MILFVKFAVVGAGVIGQLRARSIIENPATTLIGIADAEVNNAVLCWCAAYSWAIGVGAARDRWCVDGGGRRVRFVWHWVAGRRQVL